MNRGPASNNIEGPKKRTFELRAAGQFSQSQSYDVLQFREPVPELAKNKKAALKFDRNVGEGVRPSEQKYDITAGGRKYEGMRQNVGTSSEQTPCYMAIRVEDGVMTMLPVSDFYSFKPAITHKTTTLDEAEEAWKNRNKRDNLDDKKMRQMMRKDEMVGDDEDGGSGRANAGGSSRGGGGGGGGGGSKAAAFDDDDEFDDGANPAWAAGEMDDEDGNDGLDIDEGNDGFDDDDDDSNAAVMARESQYGRTGNDEEIREAADAFEETMQMRGEREAAQSRPDRGEGSDDEDDDEDEEEIDGGVAMGASSSSGWSKDIKDALRDDRRQKKKEGDSEDDHDDSDEESDMEAAIMRAAEAGGAPASRGVGATSESGRSSAQGERKRSAPGGGAPSPQDRAKMAKISDAAAALGGSGAGVQEKDLVLLLHSQGPMELSELIAKFKPFMPTKPEQAAFMALMRNVAILAPEKGVKLARLKPETKAAYGLD